MSIDINNSVRKPHILLHGDVIGNDGVAGGFSERVDNSRHLPPGATTLITGITALNKDDILTFSDFVRIIITTETGERATYERESGLLSATTFEGNDMFDTTSNIDDVNNNAETWYTLNGKEPIRSACQFYNFLDMNDATYTNDPSDEIADGQIKNMHELGFVLRTNPTGSDLVTLKAKTYWHGQESAVAMVVFKLALSSTNLEFYQTPQ